MIKLRFYFLYTSVACNLYGMVNPQDSKDTVCILHDAPAQCGAFCLVAQVPFIDHNHKIRQQLHRIALQLKETQEKLDRIEAKMEKRTAEVQESTQMPVTKYASSLFEQIGSRYFYIEKNVKKTWIDAEASCREMGGHLAAFQNRTEFLAMELKLRSHDHYWLGINDREEDGEFVSVASGKPAPFLYWNKAEPNNFGGKEDCVIMHVGRMFDMGCTKYRLNFICQSDDKV
ncbi:hypothetical protein KR084_005597 [Drosophila pseudotakahashii]|nr:hypothetical protein KR084_005597 [Drosophila pseudotakahashii]